MLRESSGAIYQRCHKMLVLVHGGRKFSIFTRVLIISMAKFAGYIYKFSLQNCQPSGYIRLLAGGI